MKILVLVKQVPAPGSVSFLPQLNRIAREGVASLLNPLDGHALEVAVEIAGPTGEVVAATMGPPQAREVLEDACARGASRGIHLVDPMFAGADTLATARAFASLVARERPDLVLGGRTTLDGATAQVVPQLAELAGLSLATEAEAVTVSAGEVEVTRRNGAFRERVRAPLPAVVSVVAAPGAPRAVPRTGGAPADARVEELDAEALGGDPASYGIRGSATYVQSVATAGGGRAGELSEEPLSWLERVESLASAPPPVTSASPGAGTAGEGRPGGEPAELWVVVEREGGAVAAVSLEALAVAHGVADRLGATPTALCFGGCDDALAARLSRAGARVARTLVSPGLDPRSPSSLADALCAALDVERPVAVLGGWTVAQRDWLARAAARRGLGMTGDVVGLDVSARPGLDDALDLVWLKPAWSGAAVARVVARTVPSLGTLRPGSTTPLELHERPVATLETRLRAPVPDGPPPARVVESSPADGAHAPVEGAGVVVLAGRGLDGHGTVVAAALARRLAAALACLPDAPVEGATAVAATTHALSPRLVVLVGDATADDLVPLRLAGHLASVAPAAPSLPVDLALVAPPAALAGALSDAAPRVDAVR